jgi:IS5 family transposase
VQGRSQDQRDFLDVESVAGHLLPAGSVFAFLAEHRHRLFPEVLFDDLFASGRGRPSVPTEVMASVIVLQTLHGLSDRETADAVTFDLRWKAACGIAVDAAAFHPSTLTYWRRRLASSDRPHRIFEVVREVIIESGALRGKHRRALDSTVLDDAVARQDTVTQLVAAVRRVGRDVDGAAPVILTVCSFDYTQTGKPQIAWDDPAARDELVSVLVADALALLAELDVDAITGTGGKAAEAVAILALVAGQDVEPAEGSDGTDGRWRIARKVAPNRMISVVDPETRHTRKTPERKQDGFKAHLAVEPDTGLATAAALTKATGPENSDASVGGQLLDADPTIPQPATSTDDITDGETARGEAADGGTADGGAADGGAADGGTAERTEVLGDSAYGTGELLAKIKQKGWDATIKPHPLRPPVDGGFSLDDFSYDDHAGTLTCPNKITRRLSKTRTVTFGAACRGCPLRNQCTTAATGRTVNLSEFEQVRRDHRERAKRPQFQHVYRDKRPLVERSIAWLTRGNRRLRYRGVIKNNAWLHHRIAGLNLRRLLTLGLRYDNGWQIA